MTVQGADNNQKLAPVKHDCFTSCKTDQPVNIRLRDGEHISSITLETVHDMLHKSVAKHPHLNALASREPGQESWKFWTYQQVYEECCKVAKSFLKLGLERYKAVCILGFNSPWWFFANLGAILAGGVGCGIYTTNKAEACHYVLEKTQANIVVVENQSQLAKILEVWDRLPLLKAVVQFSGHSEVKDDRIYSWQELLEVGSVVSDETLHDVINSQKVNQCCQIIFTSGTTGNPKGVLLSHDNITSTARRMTEWSGSKHEVILSYLPLSHIAAQMCDLWVGIAAGNTVYFAKPDALKGSLSQTLKSVRPTTFFAVPRVWEKIQQKLLLAYEQASSAQQRITHIFQSIGFNSLTQKSEGSTSTAFGFSLANTFAFKKCRRELGLDRCVLIASSAAPLTDETQRHLWGYYVPIVEMYGLSESAGPHTGGLHRPGCFKFQSVGKTISDLETKLSDDGSAEICLRGRNVMMGYLDNPDATSRAIDEEGWLHTGDLGRFDDQNFFYVTGRIKDLIITAGGENIPTTLIEEQIKKELSAIGNCALIGDERRFLSVLITLQCETDDDGLPTNKLSQSAIEFLRKAGSNSTSLHELVSGRDVRFLQTMKEGFHRVNSKATSRAQNIRKWALLPSEFTVAGGELGPTLKVRRNFITNKYKNLIDAIYAESSNSEFLVYDVSQ